MSRIQASGIFSVSIPTAELISSYQLKIIDYEGHSATLLDPYAFDSLLTDEDKYLHAEGKNLHMYNFMGAHLRHCQGTKGCCLPCGLQRH